MERHRTAVACQRPGNREGRHQLRRGRGLYWRGQFGAREAAGNSLDAMRELIDYAHRYWARVYVTVNTLLHDEELRSGGAPDPRAL